MILQKYEDILRKAKIQKPLKAYILNVTLISLLVAAAGGFLFGLFVEQFSAILAVGIAIFALVFAALLYQPIAKIKAREQRIEHEMPLALMEMAVELNIGVPFEAALKRISNKKNSELAIEIKKVWTEIADYGQSVEAALFAFAERMESKSIKRLVAQLIGVYEKGFGEDCAEPLRRLALEQLSQQRSAVKEFSGKLAVFSLIFVAVSAVVPALFQAAVTIGSIFLKFSFTPFQILLIIAVVFPLVNIAVLAFIKTKMPAFLRVLE